MPQTHFGLKNGQIVIATAKDTCIYEIRCARNAFYLKSLRLGCTSHQVSDFENI